MPKASVLTIRVPSDLKHRIDSLAEEQGVSINQLALYMFAKEIVNIESSQKIANYWHGYSKKQIESDFDSVMSKVKNPGIVKPPRPSSPPVTSLNFRQMTYVNCPNAIVSIANAVPLTRTRSGAVSKANNTAAIPPVKIDSRIGKPSI